MTMTTSSNSEAQDRFFGRKVGSLNFSELLAESEVPDFKKLFAQMDTR